ncbi:uncharacterized protein LOC102366842 isoform X2 [Latimeria chalumnae]|uniref:uncharacterized protein LOC102366842 isoform X2 n=1 Tax=Latimeria chalumnae TaxID=7897 RepID=UPI0003C17E8D|nr:PREDICTED: uncharacterized protein LOC102366842 isoform X1 [Latimeria chalumnae]XP_014353208.1 PREDICTED: uncharacterized protein LOC102366842 isoform X1 [Latimeria chalumnae]|eukprot:XP_006011072.1 PREDICTED: uncharacterized protein LOC102366842 isoform X1 [Latimeria chalumnae]
MFPSKVFVLAVMLSLTSYCSTGDLNFFKAAGSSVRFPGIEKRTSHGIKVVSWSFEASTSRIPDTILDYTPGGEPDYVNNFKNRCRFNTTDFSLWLQDLKMSDSGKYSLKLYIEGDDPIVETRELQVLHVDVLPTENRPEGDSLIFPGVKIEVKEILQIQLTFRASGSQTEVPILHYRPPTKRFESLSDAYKDRIEFNLENLSFMLRNISATKDRGNYTRELQLRSSMMISRIPIIIYKIELSSPLTYSEGSSLLLSVTEEKILSDVSQIRWIFLQPKSKSEVTILDYQPPSHNYSLLSEDYKDRIEFNKTNFSLLLQSVTPIDRGIYVLEQYNGDKLQFVKIPVAVSNYANTWNSYLPAVGVLSCIIIILTLLVMGFLLAVFCPCFHSVRWVKKLMQKLKNILIERFPDEPEGVQQVNDVLLE